ncbi:hypothetical protein M3S04_10045 [Xanthomonas sp. PPL139]|uniref:SMODS and SLOG-associating 2TM effector domain-containing protein n=2 Tax=Xanthomonas TaxID=338 RepID=A0AAU8IBW9_9XANT|nr:MULTISPECIES: hypothetical protein [unclassified Xanthomonas]MCI2261539.1 hypothetical protein [Xanthomonas indica]UYC14273.1 hypothetical protein NUG21_18340 [Xanthomonas sp. CFBP 8445]
MPQDRPPTFRVRHRICKEPVMFALFKGLGLLLEDNALHQRSFPEQVAHWQHKSEAQIRDEVALLAKAKQQWLVASIIGWQAISLILLGVITAQLWQHDYHLTFSRIVIVVTSWVAILFVIWFIANMFDRTAGFERWLTAFNSREPLSADADTVECVADALNMARKYPEILAYKREVVANRELRHEDIRIMREMGRIRLHAELVASLIQFEGTPPGGQPGVFRVAG